MEKKKDLRIIKTTLALQDSFMSLLKDKTFEEITVGEICDRAMVRRATFYNHYADKYDFLAEFMRQKSEMFQKELAEHHQAENIVDLSTNMFLKFITFIEDQHFSQNIVSSHLFSTLMPMLTEEIQSNLEGSLAAFEEKNGALPVHRSVISNYCAGGIIQLSKSWFLHPEAMTKEELLEEYNKLIAMFFTSVSLEYSLPQ